MFKIGSRSIAILPLLAACLGSEAEDASPPAAVYSAELSDLAASSVTISASATYYDVQFDLASRATRVDVTLRAQSAGDCVSLPTRIPISQVAINGIETTKWSVANDLITACDPSGLGYAAGSDVVLSVIGQEPLMTVPGTDIGFANIASDAAQYSYMLSWVEGCSFHGPCDTRPANFAGYHFVVQHAQNIQVLCPGTVTRPSATTTDCRFNYWGPSYSTHGLIARDPAWTESTLGTWAGVTMKLHSASDTNISQLLDVSAIGGSFTWLVSSFGKYPYGNELRIVTAPTQWDGFEHPGLVVLRTGLTADSLDPAYDLRHVTIHELAHQWAGNQATLANTYDFAWKEAMAEYLTYVYEDQFLQPGVSAASRQHWKDAAATAAHYPVPLDRPLLTQYFGDVYGAGPMVLFRQLEVMFGRTVVLNAIQSLIGTGIPRYFGVAEVQAALSQAVGVNLDAYFKTWVYGSGRPAWPQASAVFAESTPGSRSWGVAVNVPPNASGVVPGCAFRVRLWDASNSQWADYGFNNGPNGGQYASSATQPLAFTPARAQIDPDAECLIYDVSAPAQSRVVTRPRIF